MRRKTLVRHNEENAKFDQNSIRKAYKEIIHYYCCYFWYGLILGSFHYLTKKTDLQIVIFQKTYRFFVFLRKMKEKKLPSEEIVQYYCCYHWCGLILGLFHYLTKKKKTDLQIVILEKTHKFFVFLRKMKEKEVKKNLSNEYEPLFIPRGL